MGSNHIKMDNGITLVPKTAAPSNPTNGDVYYDDTLNKFRRYENGSWVAFDGGILSDKNYLINGNYDCWQRATAFPASFWSVANGDYTADRFRYGKGGTSAVHDIKQSTDVPSSEIEFSMLVDCTTADATVDAADTVRIEQIIEGKNLQSFAGKSMNLSFWVKATKTGTYCVSLGNAAFDRTYIMEYTVNVTNTWEKKSLTFTHDTTGTWNYNGLAGMKISWILMNGSNTENATTDTWLAGGYYASPNQVNACDSAANNFQLSQTQLIEGDDALPFRRAGVSITEEIILCKRYYEKSAGTTAIAGIGSAMTMGQSSGNTDVVLGTTHFAVEKRATPTIVLFGGSGGPPGTIWNATTNINQAPTFTAGAPTEKGFYAVTKGAAGLTDGQWYGWQWTADAEL